MNTKKQLGFTIALDLVDKLDKYAALTRRTRSQAIETLIDESSLDSTVLISQQTTRIKELEKALILAKADTVVLPEVDKKLIEENKRLTEAIESMKTNAQAAQSTIEEITNMVRGSLFNQITEIIDNEQ